MANTYVADGIDTAVRQAHAAADEKDVWITFGPVGQKHTRSCLMSACVALGQGRHATRVSGLQGPLRSPRGRKGPQSPRRVNRAVLSPATVGSMPRIASA
jgi:hypothetical protein